MKKLIFLLLLIIIVVPARSGYWQIDTSRAIFTGGLFGDCYGGGCAYGDSIFYYMEKPYYFDTVMNKSYPGSISWQSLDGGKTYKSFYGYITNCKEYQCKEIEDWGSLPTYLEKMKMLGPDTMYWITSVRNQLRTTNAGNTWEIIELCPLGTPRGHGVLDFDVQSNGLGALMFTEIDTSTSGNFDYVAMHDSIIITQDGLQSWKYVNVNTTSRLLTSVNVSIPDTNTIIANMKYYNRDQDQIWSMICRSTDKGQTWEDNEVGKNRFSSIYFISKDVGWAGGYGYETLDGLRQTVIYKTVNGGKTWKKQLTDYKKTNGIAKIVFCNSAEGFAMGYSTLDSAIIVNDSTDLILYHTKDGGEHWYREKQDSLGYKMGFSYDIVAGTSKNVHLIAGWFIFKYIDEELGINQEELPPMPEELKVYPNPAKAESVISIALCDQIEEPIKGLYLYTSTGARVSTQLNYAIETSNTISMEMPSDLVVGTYVLIIQIGKNRIKYCKLVVE